MSERRPARSPRSDDFLDELKARLREPVEYVLGCKERDLPFEGPLDSALRHTAQRIVDTAALFARQRRTLALLP